MRLNYPVTIMIMLSHKLIVKYCIKKLYLLSK